MYTLRITGPAVRRQQYTRIPMIDSLGGRVSAFVKTAHTDYRPLTGTDEERRLRATLIANALDGEVEQQEKRDGYLVFIAHVPF